MKKLRVVLEIEVNDLPDAERKELAGDMECAVSELPTLGDTSARDAAGALENIIYETGKELFAGSDVYVTYSDIVVVSSEWIGS